MCALNIGKRSSFHRNFGEKNRNRISMQMSVLIISIEPKYDELFKKIYIGKRRERASTHERHNIPTQTGNKQFSHLLNRK